MKKKLLILAVSLLCLVMTCAVIFTALSMAEGQSTKLTETQKNPTLENLAEGETPTFNTTIPLYIYDFTNDALDTTFVNESGMSHEFVDGEYITFHATSNDPNTWIKTPSIKPSEAKYVSIMHRTDAENKEFEFYYTRSDNGALADPSNHFILRLTSQGDWANLIAPCTGWANVGENVTFDVFRLDPLAGSDLVGKHIDIEYIAFFASEEDAQGFDFDQYKAKLAYEEEQKQQQQEANKDVDWPNPEFVEMDTSDLDLSDGTLNYTVSEDGSTVTISYEVNGETRSYTVPNNHNYTSGGFAATDDLDRSLYTSEQVGMYGSNGERYTGLFYFLWQGEHGDDGIFDLQKIIDELGVDAAGDVNNGYYGPVGAMHWFAEPLYGYYYASDAWVMRKHAELLCNINIDFLYFDVTNSYTYLHNATQLMEILHQLNEEGYDAPQIVFYTNTNATQVVRSLYNSVYSKNLYPDTWFCIDGKPVIVAPYEANINDFFHIKLNQWPNEASKTNGWPWMDFSWPSRVFYDESGENGAISVSIAQHSGTVWFSASSLYDNYTNRGRSFTAEEGVLYEYGTEAGKEYSRALRTSYKNWQQNQALTDQGLNFQAQWDHAIASDAKYVLVTGWNEWVAQRQNQSFVHFVDTASMEFSRDAEMMRGGYFDNYYIQLAYNVQKLNGTAPIVVQDARKPINVTGEFDQWDDVTVTYNDPSGDTVDRDATGFGRTHYTNTTGRNDIVASKVTSDSKNIYFYVQTTDDISMFDTESSWMQLYVNTDSATTGWYGYDFIINYQAKDTFTTTVAKYNGTDGAYSFETVGEVSYRVKDNQMMITVPLSMLGIEGYKEINMQFKWADSTVAYDEMEDFYIDGDCAPLGRLNYVYQNYIPGVSQIEYPEVETNAPETTQPAPETEAPAETIETEAVESDTTPVENGGCASAMGSVAAMVLVSVISLGAVCLKKKD